jgi:uncharacterized repeat protein (TIGR03843 family)
LKTDPHVTLLAKGSVEVLGLLPYASNYTFLAKVVAGASETHAVYKPTRGERPLWDFPEGTLAAREVAAYKVSEAGGWNFVPPTVLREDAPLGPGSLQLYIEHDPERHYFSLSEERFSELRNLAAFDVVVNNADRKGGHVLEDEGGKLWGVDHGVTFHIEPKLRTVIWAYADDSLGRDVRAALERLGPQLADPSGLGGQLTALLSPEESEAALTRVEMLLVEDHFPSPSSDRPLPWPLI